MTFDSLGNVVVVGSYTGSITLAGTPVTGAGGTDGFMASFTPGGDLRWILPVRGPGGDLLFDLDTAGDDRLVATGWLTSGATVGPSPPLTTNNNGQEVLVLWVDEDGSVVSPVTFGGDGTDQGQSIAAVDASDVIVAGLADADLSIGTDLLVGQGDRDAFLARVSEDRTVSWTLHLGSAGRDEANAVDVGPGGLVAGGRFSGLIMTPEGPETPVGMDDTWLATGSLGVAPTSVRAAGGSLEDATTAVLSLSPTQVLQAIRHRGSIDVGMGMVPSQGIVDALLVLRDDGVPLWQLPVAGTEEEIVTDLALGPSGEVYVSLRYVSDLAATTGLPPSRDGDGGILRLVPE